MHNEIALQQVVFRFTPAPIVNRWHEWRRRLERRRTLSGDVSREQVALMIAEAWAGRPAYVTTQSADRIKARRTQRHAARVFVAARQMEHERFA